MTTEHAIIIRAGVFIFLFLLLQFHPSILRADESSNDWRKEWSLEKGFDIEIDTEGYQFPSAIAFVPDPGKGPKDPLYFVLELRNGIKVVTNDRSVYTFAEDFINFTPPKELPDILGENGLKASVSTLTTDMFSPLLFIRTRITSCGTI